MRGKSIGNVLGFIGFVLDGFHFDFFSVANNSTSEIDDYVKSEKS